MLSKADLEFFARNGFLHLKAVVDPAACDALVAHTWTRLPAHWEHGDPGTWRGAVTDSCHTADLRERRGFMKFMRGDLVGHPVIDGSFGTEGPMGRIARALIGHALAPARIRGLYTIAPAEPGVRYAATQRPHIESHPCMLVALCYLADVARDGGGLLVWPGSHREIYPAMGSRLEHVSTPRSQDIFRKWAALDPVQVPGQRGDVVVIHHRLLHAPSLNRRHQLRFGFLCDYHRDDFERLATLPPSADLWEDWPAIRALAPQGRDAASDFALRPQKRSWWRALAALLPRRIRRHSAARDASNIRKKDASALARLRKPGDVWLVLSDDPRNRELISLDPRGADLRHYSVRVDGQPVRPACRHDFIARLAVQPGPHVLEIDGIDRPTWLRLLHVRLPFTSTLALARRELPAGAPLRLEFTVPQLAVVAAQDAQASSQVT